MKANKKMANKRKKRQSNSITTSADRIICSETTIQLTDEKLKNLLSRIYEKARRDAIRLKVYRYYDVLFSVAFTLVMSLLTANFKSIMNIKADVITRIAQISAAICFVLGLAFCLISVTKRHESETKERDSAVDERLSEILQNKE